MTNWKYADVGHKIVYRTLDDGTQESTLSTLLDPSIIPDPVDPAVIASVAQATQDAADITAAKAYNKLAALQAMTPTKIQTWVNANVTTLAQAQDAIKTLAIAVSVLLRRL